MKFNKKFSAGLFAAAIGILASSSPAWADLTTLYSISGNVGISSDAGGSIQNSLPDGLTAEIPAGSTVIQAYLFTSTYNESFGPAGTPIPSADAGGTFGGVTVNYNAVTANTSSDLDLQAGVADVTSIVQAAVGSVATGGVYNFAVTETNTGEQDGELLDVIYTNPSLPVGSIGILDGGASSTGDTSSINFASSPAGDTVYLSLGDGFSYDLDGETTQNSTINVDGSLLTSAAGNCDESQDGGTPPNATTCYNGDLITDGVLGLNADGSVDTTYSNPFTTIGDTDTDTDHELYNISSLVAPADGDTISLTTSNTSLDDNIFTEAFYVNGVAGFNAPPPPSGPPAATPEPGTLSLFATGISSVGMLLWRRRKIA